MLFALFFFVIGGLFLGSAILSILLPFLTAALNIAAIGLLVWNAAVLLFLLVFRFLWKRAGRLDKTYIHSFPGWRRWALQGIKVLLAVGMIWAILMISVCVALLLGRPLDRLLPYWPYH